MFRQNKKRFKISIKVPALNKEVAHFWGDYHFAVALGKCFMNEGHSVRIDLFPDWYSFRTKFDDLVIVLRGRRQYEPKKRHYNIMWNISHPDKITAEEYEQYDHVYVASESYADELKKKSKTEFQSFYNALILIYLNMLITVTYPGIDIYS